MSGCPSGVPVLLAFVQVSPPSAALRRSMLHFPRSPTGAIE